ncbi:MULTISPECIES: PTS glucitol/sorbitol transporter subunit IIC [unclassified Mesorhizobium]|jgi:PTS system glucitol/sorbitol-specific IIC component|uniref:PTS glucitol/sorbitol transporter subunit IIC n=1 Tax=unclassified Mesorhizobium TaxID=325217 RepID=UPI000FCA4091|nr:MULTISPECIES: PTS glucitol/sorbitol transporter subunit IIC [unclassified Mesorhizobium]RUW97960.1 PTS beta-glucoside transporter subunit IIABC [Mesorhizobium sp. M8A.F.Ca.ET.059.01.1.1]RUW98018.1 PTS beta-glucoside transporter subunit IIABC [Mesorhizobium sp. M8A.F.Ca.ET.023.01.1.1]RVD53558.1 PTS beta-glucoside transporter subunit IIABC [Mesorhizobium sp. M8A.F.Ca.ET.023.02.2.1]TGR40081.1 PTS beta-glucoside transporter subunit IIABC [bacterium M00.F.Ca.ET.199.01.1.1]TGU24284.1 PTS beta-glu
MSVFSLLAQHADMAVHNLHVAGAMVSDAALHGKLAVEHASDHLVVLAQADSGPITVDQFKEKLKDVQQEEQLGWLTAIGKYFIGIFQKGGEVFAGFVTGIIPTLVVLMTAFYAVTELVGEERVHGLARGAGRIALTRYTLLPLLAVFFLTNPMAYTFGSFLEEKHKPAFYDAAVSYVHPPLGLFPHINPGEYFVWGGILVALLELEKKGAVVAGYHVKVAIWYAIVGLVVILLKGMLTERITAIMARRQGVEL